jgi:hypothetical protein
MNDVLKNEPDGEPQWENLTRLLQEWTKASALRMKVLATIQTLEDIRFAAADMKAILQKAIGDEK